jgi:hypothetical protein
MRPEIEALRVRLEACDTFVGLQMIEREFRAIRPEPTQAEQDALRPIYVRRFAELSQILGTPPTGAPS